MRKFIPHIAVGLMLAFMLAFLGLLGPATGQSPQLPSACAELAFSTEEDFVTRGPAPPDGNLVISDGDLLGPNCIICARNLDLVGRFDVRVDLGLDAVDVIDVGSYLVAFSTELDSPNSGQFTAGDLLVTNGTIIPNRALLAPFQVPYDLGLDGLQFIGDARSIRAFLAEASKIPREEWLRNLGRLAGMLRQYNIDIWFSTEGSLSIVGRPGFLDGDLLSARDGVIVATNSALLPASVPAGIPERGVDYGLDAIACDRSGNRQSIQFSTEILYRGQPAFTDGDLLHYGNGVGRTNEELVRCFEPRAGFLGLDAISIGQRVERETYLQLLLKLFRRR